MNRGIRRKNNGANMDWSPSVSNIVFDTFKLRECFQNRAIY